MNIRSINSRQSESFYSKSTNVQSESVKKSVFLVEETEGNTIQKDSFVFYKELSNKYDVRNATFEEIVEISNALYEVGEITFKEHLVLIFDYDRATNNIKRYAPGYIPVDFDMYETSANSNGRRDWIAEFGARAAKDFKFGNLVGYQSNKKVLDIFEKLLR